MLSSVFSEADAEYTEAPAHLSQLFGGSSIKQGTAGKDAGELCLVCFDKPPDAVTMSCGHGGLCYDCAMEIWRKTSGCYICRAVNQFMLIVL